MDKILPHILAWVTGHTREKVEIKWSTKLWTHNLFRIWELLFWRRVGVRPSVVSWIENGVTKQVAYSFEAQIALFEVYLRSLFKQFAFSIVVVPQLQLAGMAQGAFMPYRFAIALDVSTNENNNAGNSLSHTCTGSNLVFTGVVVGDIITDALSNLTYAGASMFPVTDSILRAGDRWVYLGVLAAPATGANNFTETGLTFRDIIATSYTGCAQTGQPDSHATANKSVPSTTVSFTTTVVAANCWIIGYSYGGNGGYSSNTATLRNTPISIAMGDSNGTVPTGSQTVTLNETSGADTNVMCSLSPTGGAVTTISLLSLLGVGI